MKLAIIGSRSISVKNLDIYIPQNTTEIVSGGAKGIDSDAAEYAIQNNIKLTVFLPDYKRYRRGAPLKRNEQIAEYADMAIAFWDGKSKGTQHTISLFQKLKKEIEIIILQ